MVTGYSCGKRKKKQNKLNPQNPLKKSFNILTSYRLLKRINNTRTGRKYFALKDIASQVICSLLYILF